MRLAIVHYHLRKGGVTRVIASALEALGGSIDKAVVLSSTPTEETLPCPVAVIPELAYTNTATPEAVDALHRKLIEEARAHLGGDPDLWHIHNHSLGKNVNFPEVLGRLLESGARALLQIHDFSEDGRPANYQAQRKPYADGVFDGYDLALYPVSSQIGYAVLNGRDRDVLEGAGIPEDRIFWLPNAVSVPEVPDTGDSTASASDPPLILYPTRAIRRKNLGELLLLARAYPDFHYATTLSPKNPEWQAIHNAWADLARRLQLPVSFALGEQAGQSFEGLVRNASAMVSTSVGEGFGLAFLEPWLFGKPVLGRDLPEITRDFKDNGITLADLYPEWRVSCNLFDVAGQAERFLKTAERMYSSYGQPFKETDIRNAWADLVQDGRVDFGMLDETAQAEVLHSTATGSGLDALVPPIDMNRIDRSVIGANREHIADLYGLPRYGKSLRSIYETLLEAPLGTPRAATAGAVLEAFLEPHRIRMLRT
jgi:glycosyltransferase involved in cell wall biosynthesis